MQEGTASSQATTGPSEIRFYSRTGKYPWLSNFYWHGFFLDGVEWYTVEHYFQAQKFPDDPDYRDLVRFAPHPREAKMLGRARPCRPDWDDVRDDVMLRALRLKFAGWEQGRAWLLLTGDAVLIEDSPTDMYWGGALPGSQNRLGELLMQVRDELRNAPESRFFPADTESEDVDGWTL